MKGTKLKRRNSMNHSEECMKRFVFFGIVFILIVLILFFVSKFVIKDFKEFFGIEFGFGDKEGRLEKSEVDRVLMAPRNEPLIIDHRAVDEFEQIPDYWIEKVKSNGMSVQYVGASHATQMPKGLILLEWNDNRFNSENGSNPNLFNENSLRLLSGRYTGSWSQGAGANEYWYLESGRLTTERTAIEANRIGKAINISLWGWSYHVCNPAYSTGQIGHPFNDTDLDSYLQALERFNNNESINQTIYVYHTSVSDCSAYADPDAPWKLNRYNDLIKQTAIDKKGIVFDQADIENWNIDNTARRVYTDYLGRATYIRHTDYNEGASGVGPDTFSADHTNDALEIRKAKALWWLMARLAGWSGVARLPNAYTFNGSTTNFSAVANISEVSDAILEKIGKGKINFVGHVLDFANLDLDRHVVIENNKIGLNSSILQELNVSALLTLYNTGITGNVKILEDDKDCAHCSLIKNDNGNVSFSVGHFSEFSVMALGDVYYLDSVNGDDANPGTEQLPWRTWSKAQSALRAGDGLYMTGDFGDVTIGGSDPVGTADSWIEYRTWPGKSQPKFDSLTFSGGIRDVYLKFYGFAFDPGYTSSGKNAVLLLGASNIKFDSCYFEGAKVLGAIGDFAPYTFGNDAIFNSGWVSSSNITINNCTFLYGYNVVRNVEAPGESWIITNNHISEFGDNGGSDCRGSWEQ